MPISVSIVVITKNNVRTIGKCVESLLNQKYDKKDYEIIFVDGHSSDGTDKIIKKYAETSKIIKLYYENVGTMGYARNIGIHKSKGNIIAFTDGDAFPEKEWLNKLTKAFSNESNLGIVGGLDILTTGGLDSLTTDEARVTIDSWRRLKKTYDRKAITKIKTVNFAIRRDIALTCGGFDPTLSHFDEGELKARIYFTMKSVKILYDPKIVVYHDRQNVNFRTRIKKKYVKSSMGVPVLLKKHMLKAALLNIVSPLGTSLLFVFACILTPMLLWGLFYLLGDLFKVTLVFLALGFTTIILYMVMVKRTTGKLLPKLPLLLVLDFFPLFAGTFVGLMRWLVKLFNKKLRTFIR